MPVDVLSVQFAGRKIQRAWRLGREAEEWAEQADRHQAEGGGDD